LIKFTILALIAGGLIIMDYRGSRLLPIRTGLKMLAYPLQYAVDVPYKVVISESITLAKMFGSDKSHAFVNGVLDKLAKELRKVEIAGK